MLFCLLSICGIRFVPISCKGIWYSKKEVLCIEPAHLFLMRLIVFSRAWEDIYAAANTSLFTFISIFTLITVLQATTYWLWTDDCNASTKLAVQLDPYLNNSDIKPEHNFTSQCPITGAWYMLKLNIDRILRMNFLLCLRFWNTTARTCLKLFR